MFAIDKKLNVPLLHAPKETENVIDWSLFRISIAIVIIIRGSYFLFSPLGVQLEWIAIVGVAILFFIRWLKTREGIVDVLKQAPWHILFFAFGMYVIVYALNNSGITAMFIKYLQGPISESLLSATFIFGILTSMLSNVMNNLPSVMLGTLILTDLNLDTMTTQASYLAIIIGSDIGALLTPMGTLATLLWMFVLRREDIRVTWGNYFKVAILVIPVTLIVTLTSFYIWLKLIVV